MHEGRSRPETRRLPCPVTRYGQGQAEAKNRVPLPTGLGPTRGLPQTRGTCSRAAPAPPTAPLSLDLSFPIFEGVGGVSTGPVPFVQQETQGSGEAGDWACGRP